MNIKNYRGFTFRFTMTATGSVAVALHGCYDNWMTLGCVKPSVGGLRSFLDEVIDDGACAHLICI